jgi:prephenate dehydratase
MAHYKIIKVKRVSESHGVNFGVTINPGNVVKASLSMESFQNRTVDSTSIMSQLTAKELKAEVFFTELMT